jgi:hypothetical protein
MEYSNSVPIGINHNGLKLPLFKSSPRINKAANIAEEACEALAHDFIAASFDPGRAGCIDSKVEKVNAFGFLKLLQNVFASYLMLMS